MSEGDFAALERIADLFDVPLDVIVRKKRRHVIGFDPTSHEARPVVAFPYEAGVFYNQDGTRANTFLAPTWMSQAGRFNVPQKINNPKENSRMDMSGIARMRSELEGMLVKFTGMVAVVERFGGEPAEDTVIRFEHEFDRPGNDDRTVYSYVAIRRGAHWYVSGRPFNGNAITWSTLLEFIGDGRAWICREFEEVPMPGTANEAGDGELLAMFTDVLSRPESSGRTSGELAKELLDLMRGTR